MNELTCPKCGGGELAAPDRLRIRAFKVHDGKDWCSECIECRIWFHPNGAIVEEAE